MRISLAETNKAEECLEEDAEAEGEGNCLEAEASEVDEESDEGTSSVKLAGMGEIVLGCTL